MGPWIRILIRYGSGALVAYGVMSGALARELQGDPDVVAGLEIAVGVIAGLATEIYYILAKKYGWPT